MRATALLCALAAMSLAGCNDAGSPTINAGSPATLISPLAGKWSGKSEVKGGDVAKALNSLAGGPLTGPSSLTLNSDGTGYFKVADKAERPITWKQDGEKLLIQARRVDEDASSEAGAVWVGTVSGDGKYLTIDMEEVKVRLSKNTSG
jgi:hypothetical protein